MIPGDSRTKGLWALLLVFFYFTSLPASATTISTATIKKEIQEYVHRRYPMSQIRSIALSRAQLHSNYASPTLSIRPRSVTKSHLYLRIAPVPQDDKSEQLEATVHVKRMAYRVIALRTIDKEERIRPEDLTRVLHADNGNKQYLEQPKEAAGMFARQKIRKGKALKYYNLHPEYLVRKRERVKLLFHSGAIRIELLGIALENGGKGDEIKVKNVSSKKVLKCKVIAKHTVTYTR